MWNTLTWQSLRAIDIASEVESLREDALQVFLGVATVGYVGWHTVAVLGASPEDGPRYWALFAVVVPGLGCTHVLQRRGSRLAAWCFLFTSLLSITTAAWLLATPTATLLYPAVVLAAVALLHPLAGLVVGVGSVGTLLSLRAVGPLAFLSPDRLLETAIASLLAMISAWALGRNLVVALGWSLDSYAQALRNAQEAQSHRAQLVQALKQLDNAYYRLERANAALELAWKAAEAAERSKSEFVTNISHELRTPLNLIVGFSEMIVTSPESYGVPMPAAYRSDLFAIYRSAQHLLTLIDDVIDLARVGIGRLALAREPVDLAQVIGDACDIVREYVAAKELWLRIETQANLPALVVDPLRIRQVLLNLLTNAARFTERGGITVSASLDDGWVTVKVADTGQAIAPHEIPRVFDEFYHDGGESSPRQAGLGGIGLGLPISKRLIELHGGQMGVESAVGVGTTFWFALPVAPVDGAPQGVANRPRRLAGMLGIDERVVVLVGADVRVARFLERHLRGYRVVTAQDFASGVTAAVDYRAMAILADLDAVHEECGQDTPVPVLRLPLPHEGRIASALGAAACLTKPVTRQDLCAAVERLGRRVETLLVVDDDQSFVDLVTRMLRASGRQPEYDILSAHNGREALALMETIRPDVVLLDLVMPELRGEEVFAAMAATPHLADVPVIVVSAQDQSEEQFALLGPITASKPDGFRLEELLRVVESLLNSFEPPRRYLTDDREVGISAGG